MTTSVQPGNERLVDRFGRVHDNLRISVTDRCNIRCFYCMPERGVRFMPQQDMLSFDEIERFVRVAVGMGITKVRITGGEPLVRQDLPRLVRRLCGISGIRDLALTTNGVLLRELAHPLYEAGLRRINVHLDTLDPARFFRITRRHDVDKVLDGIALCRRLGFGTIKVNTVAMKNLTESDLVPLARYGRQNGIEIRYTEFMPLDAQGIWDESKLLRAEEIIEILSKAIAPLTEMPDGDPHSPARQYRYADGLGKVGIIASVSRPFCLNCNRIRLTANGRLRYCLFALEEMDVSGMLRNGASDQDLTAAIRGAVCRKWQGHTINTSEFIAPSRPMYSIGG